MLPIRKTLQSPALFDYYKLYDQVNDINEILDKNEFAIFFN